MIRKYLLLIVLLLFGISSFSQNERNLVDKLNASQELSALNSKVLGLVKKDPYLKKMQGLQVFHVYFLKYQGKIEKEDFINHTFLNRLNLCYVTHRSLFGKKKYLDTQALICDSLGHLIASSNSWFISPTVSSNTTYFQEDLDFLRVLHEKQMDILFYITGTSMDIHFGIKGKDIYVIKESSKETNIYPLEDFINCCWDTFYLDMLPWLK